MATLPRGTDGAFWTITNIKSDVLIIENPGLDEEHVHLRLNTKQKDLLDNVDKIQESAGLTDDQKKWSLVWYGYFYAHLMQRQGV